MSLKALLLTPETPVPVTRTLLGGEFELIRLPADRLSQFEKNRVKYSQEQDADKLNDNTALLVLDSIIDEDGNPMSQAVKPKELLKTKSIAAINAAMSVVLKLNYMADGAEEEAKEA
ncbi:Phage tail protein [Vibrio crassostreae]|nr:Phage tail protein [Vibrio crassostreae]CAK2103245.1 Phage tail protein [Vibrio crassostreae]CAK2372639.1 Phage tail protein [Vibrio crassostreae]CAK2909367.1 Phage tail protein [Vibrio crassostreae]CAK2984179.1 Phage tail protein [Vibrio crassostreae]